MGAGGRTGGGPAKGSGPERERTTLGLGWSSWCLRRRTFRLEGL